MALVSYPAGKELAMPIPLADNLTAVESGTWTLTGRDDVEIVPVTALTDLSQPLTVTIPAVSTALATGDISGMRTATVVVHYVGGATETVSVSFVLLSGDMLSVPTNSFITYAQAIELSYAMYEADVIGWVNLDTRMAGERALLGAFRDLMALPLKVNLGRHATKWFATLDAVERGEVFEDDPRMLTALAEAQLMQAAYVSDTSLGEVTKMREEGVVSMTVGESSQFYGTSKPSSTPVGSKKARRLLSPWLDTSMRLGRA